MFTTKGKLVYDPRDAAADRKGIQFWWAILEVDYSIIRYYQAWILREYGVYVNTPLWKSHISIIRGETPKKPYLWKRHAGKKYEFTYSPDIQARGEYFAGFFRRA